MTFALINERQETVVRTFFTRAPIISFISETDGDQYLSVSLSEVEMTNEVPVSETALDIITLKPEEVIGTQLINPLTNSPIEINGSPVLIDQGQVFSILYTIFKVALEKRIPLQNENT